MTTATGDSLSFGYDALKRLNRVTVKNGSSVILNTAYAYRDVSWNRGSAQVEFRNVRLGSDSGMLLEGKKYSYDKAGNLVMISESTGDFNKLVEYTYDSQNQLTSEAYYKSGEAEAYITYNYTYDTAGNLLTVSQKKGNTTTLLQTYTYGDAQWHDLLTAVNGQAITYDASGNPLSYGGWSFGWQNGRQLKTASKTSDGKTETLEYSYDADGIRTSKTYTVETFTQLPDYTVTFTADGATVKTMTVEDGYTLKDSDYPAVPTKTGYTGEWVKYTAAVHSNVTVQVKYTAVSTDHTVTFKANGKTVKTMVVPDGYVLQDSDYPPIPPRVGYKGSWSKVTTAIRRDTVIYASYMPNGGGIVIPTQPTSPGEIMSGGEGEPVEADVPAKDETISPQGMHVTGTQTVTHEYLTLNGKVARETIRTNNTLTAVLDFIYDASGKPFALKYSTNGTSFQTYYYVLNLQGDVVKLIHYIPGFEYESVATYEYDAWGNVSSSGRLAEINPLRYRGYYYDSETGFYYLQSRYYDPANRRFINADIYASTDSNNALACNMYSYCWNNVVILYDSEGELPKIVTVLDVQTHATGTDNDSGAIFFATTITYTETFTVNSFFWTVYESSSTYTNSYEFKLTPNGVLQFDNTQVNANALLKSQISECIASEMLRVSREVYPDALSNRSVRGIANELVVHYLLSDIVERAKVADMGDTKKTARGYDRNAWIFEALN